MPQAVGVGNPAVVQHGDVPAGLTAASIRIDASDETSPQ
jgi:xanthine dehydrogenase YagR molybdenum-binding subunit